MSTPGRLDLFGDVLKVLDAQSGWNATTQTALARIMDGIGELWQDNADLRDELHALANRVEALTRMRTDFERGFTRGAGG